MSASGSEKRSAQGSAAEDSPRLPAGRVGRPHGLDGSFYVTRPRARLLSLGVEVGLDEDRRKIVRRAGTDQHPILRLDGVENRTGAEALRGRELTVEQSDAPALGEGEWWAHELEGCEVRDGKRLLGRVRRLLELPSCEALEVERDGGAAPLLVPMVSAAIREVAPSERRIEVDAAFLDLEAPAPGTETPPDS